MTSDERVSGERGAGKRVDARRAGGGAPAAGGRAAGDRAVGDRVAGDRATGVGEGSVSAQVRATLSQPAARERTWRIGDFGGHPAMAVAQALSRLARDGAIVRVSKGVYAVKGSSQLRTRVYDTRGGGSASERAPLFPSGLLAFNELRMTFQNTPRPILATPAVSAPREVTDEGYRVITRRPAAWFALEKRDGAILEVLRQRAIHSQLEPEDTVRVITTALLEDGRLARLLEAAPSEPPRVRAMLGALIEQSRRARAAVPSGALDRLRESLGATSKYDFGRLGLISTGSRWRQRLPRPYA